MQLQSDILTALIQDKKTRRIENTNAFGDIIFSEDNGYGYTVYSICRIYLRSKYGFSDGVEKKIFSFDIHVLASVKDKGKKLLFFKTSPSLKLSGDVKKSMMHRNSLLTGMKQRLGVLSNQDVYGYCTLDDYNSDNPFAEKIATDQYYQAVLQHIHQSPKREYSDIWELNSPDDFSEHTQKLYYGYGFEVPNGIMSCPNLRSLGIWHQAVKNEDLNFSQLKNLNELVLRNLHIIPDELLSSLQQLPYLVSLDLSSNKDSTLGTVEGIPSGLASLQVLRYFDFSGNKIKDWSPLLAVKSLQVLTLSHASIDVLPEAIGDLSELVELDLSDNDIAELPKSLTLLKKLRVLNVSKNPLRVIPEWLTEMEQLRELNITQTQLTSLPESIANLTQLTSLGLKKNLFTSLPQQLLKIPKRIIELEERNKALYDEKIKIKMDKYPKGDALFENDFNFKLQIIQKLMYEDEVLQPIFSVYDFVDSYAKRTIDIEQEGYALIPEVEAYFKELRIPMELLIDIKELESDGGDNIYSQLIPFWDGEDESFTVESVADVSLLPNLKRVNDLFFSKEAIKQLRNQKIKVSNS